MTLTWLSDSHWRRRGLRARLRGGIGDSRTMWVPSCETLTRWARDGCCTSGGEGMQGGRLVFMYLSEKYDPRCRPVAWVIVPLGVQTESLKCTGQGKEDNGGSDEDAEVKMGDPNSLQDGTTSHLRSIGVL